MTTTEETREQTLAGKTALVTGGASGIGAATVEELARRGARVAVLDREGEGAARNAAAADALTSGALALTYDLGDTSGIPGVVAQVLDAFGRIDILVNCAGMSARGGLLDLSEEDWDLVHVVNLKAPMRLMQEVARHMIERGEGGRIVNVSSSSAFRARSHVAYASSKAAIVQLSRSAAAELGPHGINVNAVAPGLTRTGMTGDRDIDADAREGYLSNLVGRAAEPPDVAAAIVFLCLPESRQITAQTIHTSAGLVV
ncbi:MAG: SDR family oxidoreductase [Chloroflexi bacterium]|nr:SDR family oxidoreductase [Chloroflexota bacterium]